MVAPHYLTLLSYPRTKRAENNFNQSVKFGSSKQLLIIEEKSIWNLEAGSRSPTKNIWNGSNRLASLYFIPIMNMA